MGNEITYPLERCYALSVAEVCKVLDTDETLGITNAEAEKRSLKFGLNIYQS